MIYATVEFYKEYSGSIQGDENILKQLKNASRIIDILTFNRLHRVYPEGCSEWEREILAEVCCEISDFYFSNGKDLSTLLNKYSLNGVSMEWGKSNSNIQVVNGITILRTTYSKLNQTRFTNRTLGGC